MAKGPKTQAVVDLLVSSGSFSFWQTQKFSIQSGAYAYFMIYNICNKFIAKKINKNLIFLVKSIDFVAEPMVKYNLPKGT